MEKGFEKLLVVDGNNLLYSSYHAFHKLSWKIENGAIFLFLRVLISILKRNIYQRLLVVFDGGGSNFRQLLLSQYKAQREKMPEDLLKQMETLKLLLIKVNITYVQLVNHEADDVIASFVTQNSLKHPDAVFDIFTRDKDLLQLIDKKSNILKYVEKKITLYTEKNFNHDYGFLPQSYVDYLSLLGDNVDNIKGIKGIGPVSARKLIQQFQTIENIYQQINNLPENFRKLLEDQKDLVICNKKIVNLEKNIFLSPEIYENCNFNWEEWKNNKELRNFCYENSFNSIIKLLN